MHISASEINWHYTIKGQGDPLLFLHGGLDTFANYEILLTELAENFRVIAVDRRGHGKTADTKAPFEYNSMAEELISFTQALDLPPFHIVGFSDGANLALHMASRMKDNVKSVIAISGNYSGVLGMSDNWIETVGALSADFVREHMPEVAEQYAELNPPPDFENFICKTQALWREDCVIEEDRLKKLQAPILIVGGDRDIVLPEQFLDMKKLIPNASLLLLPYCGHFVYQDFAWSKTSSSTVHLFKDFLMTHFDTHNTDFF